MHHEHRTLLIYKDDLKLSLLERFSALAPISLLAPQHDPLPRTLDVRIMTDDPSHTQVRIPSTRTAARIPAAQPVHRRIEDQHNRIPYGITKGTQRCQTMLPHEMLDKVYKCLGQCTLAGGATLHYPVAARDRDRGQHIKNY